MKKMTQISNFSSKNRIKPFYQIFKECLKETQNNEHVEKSEFIRQEQGEYSLQLFFLNHPIISIVATNVICMFFGIASSAIGLWINKSLIMGLILIVLWFILLNIPIILSMYYSFKINSLISVVERWSTVISIMILRFKNVFPHKDDEQIKIEIQKRLKREINNFELQMMPFKLILGVIWGGVFIGCLPDKTFQIALTTLKVGEIFTANPFGAICLFLTLPLVSIYIFKWLLPIIWMRQVSVLLDSES